MSIYFLIEASLDSHVVGFIGETDSDIQHSTMRVAISHNFVDESKAQRWMTLKSVENVAATFRRAEKEGLTYKVVERGP